MRNRYRIFFMGLFASAFLIGGTMDVEAQNKNKKKIPVIEVKARVTDVNGQPLRDVMVLSGGGAITNYTDVNGCFSLKTKANGTILIETPGYKDAVINLQEGGCPSEIKLELEGLYSTERDIYERGDGAKTYQSDLTAAIGHVNIEHLKTMPELQLSNTLQGQAAGLIAIAGTGGIGYDNSTLYIRGHHNNGTNNAIVIVDGIERPIDDILPEEIESIEILKDAPAKILYGAQATNGVVLVRTKRGEAHKRIIRLGLEYGVQPTTRLPKYLDSYNYATLFNEARENDGMSPFYTDKDLEGYRHSSGVNDLLYPNVDYYKEFLRDQNTFWKATLELNGGNKNATYAVTVGYTGSSGLEKVGDRSDLNRINARGNLDIRITDFLSVAADVAARIEKKDWGAKDGEGLFGEISTLRSNEYPFIISPEAINGHDGIAVDGSSLIFGASSRKSSNLYSDMAYGGNTSERYVNSQTNLGLKFDLNEFVEGLTADAYMTFDNYSYLRQELRNAYPTYSIDRYLDANGDEVLRFTERKRLNLPKKQSIVANNTYRYFGWRANVGYENRFGLHGVSANAAFRYTQEEATGSSQDSKDANFTFRANYNYDKRYMLEGTLSAMGSNKFEKGSQYFFARAIGAAWVLSNESFLKNMKKVDFLKLKASCGHLGYAGNTGFFLYRTNWKKGDKEEFRPTIGGNTTDLSRWGNPDLEWEYSNELNVGAEGLFLHNRLSTEINYFRELRKNIIGVNNAKYAATGGDFIPYENIGEVMNQGFDAYVSWNDKIGKDFTYNVGFNITYTKNKLRKSNELSNMEEYRKAIGRPTSTIFGWQAQGLFGKDVPLAGHANQTFGNYQVGDIAYADLNGDGTVDNNDQKSIGQSFPTTTMGIDVTLNYKGFGLYILGTVTTGITKLCTSSYYWNSGLNGYSVLAFDRYHPVNNPEGTQPRLTTMAADNNQRNSTFWAENGSFFRLKNIELSYTLVNKSGKGIGKNYKFFVRGTNLFVLSGIKDLDPERILSGVTNYPTYRTVTGGLSISF